MDEIDNDRENDFMKFPSECRRFYESWSRQNFSLRNSFISYIVKNPSSSKVYLKLINSCKYFYIKNSILVVPRFTIYQCDDNKYVFKFNEMSIRFKKISAKIWITDIFDITKCSGDESNVAQKVPSIIIPKIYQCDIRRLVLGGQNIFYKTFIFFSSNIEDIHFTDAFVKDGEGTVIPLECIIKTCSKLQYVGYHYIPSNSITSKTAEEFTKISHFSNLKNLSLSDIPEVFDVENFFTFIKGNKRTDIQLDFSHQISEEYKIRLKAIVDEILQIENHSFKVPLIYFSGNNIVSEKKLGILWQKTLYQY